MDEISPAKKAWETMKHKSPAKKAWDTINRQKGAKKGAQKIKEKQWEQEKIEHLRTLECKAKKETCIVCGDSRKMVLQDHHLEPDDDHTVKLCANCHDIVRRGTLEDLKEINFLEEGLSIDLIDSAINLAVKAHRNQTKKGTNSPYIVHPISVALILLQAGCSEEVIAAGMLHDTVEDKSQLRTFFGHSLFKVSGRHQPVSWLTHTHIQSDYHLPLGAPFLISILQIYALFPRRSKQSFDISFE